MKWSHDLKTGDVPTLPGHFDSMLITQPSGKLNSVMSRNAIEHINTSQRSAGSSSSSRAADPGLGDHSHSGTFSEQVVHVFDV